MNSDRERGQRDTVTVCAACKREACWQGVKYCENYRSAGTIEVERGLREPDEACCCDEFRSLLCPVHSMAADPQREPDEVGHRPFCAGWTDHGKDGPGCRRMDLLQCDCPNKAYVRQREPDEVERECLCVVVESHDTNCDCYEQGKQEERERAAKVKGVVAELLRKIDERKLRGGSKWDLVQDVLHAAAAIRRGEDA